MQCMCNVFPAQGTTFLCFKVFHVEWSALHHSSLLPTQKENLRLDLIEVTYDEVGWIIIMSQQTINQTYIGTHNSCIQNK